MTCRLVLFPRAYPNVVRLRPKVRLPDYVEQQIEAEIKWKLASDAKLDRPFWDGSVELPADVEAG